MIGRKTLAEIRRDISKRLRAEGIDEAALLKELGHLQPCPHEDKAAVKSLLDLAKSLKRPKRRRVVSKPSR